MFCTFMYDNYVFSPTDPARPLFYYNYNKVT